MLFRSDQELDRIMREYCEEGEGDLNTENMDSNETGENIVESVEIIREIIPLELEYTIQFDSSNNNIN